MKDRTEYNYVVYWMVLNYIAAVVSFNYTCPSVFSIQIFGYFISFSNHQVDSPNNLNGFIRMNAVDFFLSLLISFFIFNVSVVKDQLSMQS